MQAYTVNTWLPSPTGKPPEANEVQRRLWTAVQRRDLPGQATYDQYALAGQYDGAVYIALQAISSAMSGATMQVLKRKEGSKSLAYNANDANANKDWIPAGDECGACRLLSYINPQQTPINFLVEYITCLLLFGRVFVYAVPSRSGKPCELWVIRPQYVMPLYAVSPEYPFGAWRVTIPMPFMYGFAQSGTVIIDARDMVEERMFNPQFPWDGYSPLTAGAQQIDTLRSVNESRKNTLDRGPSVDAVVTIDGASETELSRIKAEYENKYTGSRGSRVMFSSGESAKAAALGIAPKEMDFASGYDQLTNFVLGLLGVPHPVAQLTDTSSYAQLYASIQQFRELRLKPLANAIAAHWTKHLIQKHWGDEYAMTFDMPRLTNPESEEAAIQALGGMGVYTVNEIRAKRNEEPIEGGDVPASVYVQTLQAKQQATMQPQPGMEGMPASGAEDAEQPGGELGDMLMNGVMDSLGDGKVMKAMFEESKHPRDHGKFASKPGASGGADEGHDHVADYKANGTNSKAFKAWFGDSKVVDESGEPLVVHHGTAADFDEFKQDTKNAWSDTLGFDTYFFSEGKATASTYANQFENGKVKQTYLSIKNPLEIDANGGEWVDALDDASSTVRTYRTPEEKEYLDLKSAYENKYSYELDYAPEDIPESEVAKIEEALTRLNNHIVANRKLYGSAKRMPYGYDGIIVKNVMDSTSASVDEDIESYSPFTTVYVAFHPSQIKSVDNDGTFNPNDNRMHKSRHTKAMGWTAVQTRGGKTAAKNTSTGVMVYGKRAAELLKDSGPKEYPQVDLRPDSKRQRVPADQMDGIDLGDDVGSLADVMKQKTENPKAIKTATPLAGANGMKIAKVAKTIAPQVEQHLQTPEGKEQAKTIDKWAPILAKKHAAVVAAKTGMADAEAHDLLLMLIQTVVSHLPIIGKVGGSVVGILRHQNTKQANSKMRGAIDDHTASVASQRAGLDPEDDASTLPRNKNGSVRLGRNRIAGALTPPKNKAGKGSLPPRAMLKKSLRYIDRILEAEVRS